MDKKAKYTQSSTKGTASDSKKTQDVANSKVFPKTSRKREPPGTSSFPKYEQPRRSNVPKTKNFDKRPKPKGQYYGSAKEDTKVVDNEAAEYGSVMVPGSKKQNLNHLLNFHYEPRDVQGSSWNRTKSSVGYNRNSNRWLPPTQRHKYNKEQFLQASCQFVVTAKGDYTLYLANPDILVEWSCIEQIKVHSFESFSCPICLCPPVAGKMTRCGHIYCWPCILHYLSLSDKSWRKCPICYEAIRKSDLKSVVAVTQNAFNTGDKITLRLMRRERGSLLAVPAEGPDTPVPTRFFSVSKYTSNPIYSKLLTADAKNIMDIIECERVQLNVELIDNPGSPENCYIEQALNELQEREDNLLQKLALVKSEEVTESVSTQQPTKPETEQFNEQEVQGELESINKEGADSPNVQEMQSSDITAQNTPLQDPQASSSAQKFFYFYQADDGQHLYLHAMNVKMLELQYGSLEHCPKIITGKLLEKEGGSFTEELRRRLRYLGHLPLTCQFEVAEIEIKPPIVSAEVLRSFREQIELRQKRRQRREREERKREKKITEEENKRMGKYPTPNVHIESTRHFPEWQPEVLFAEDNVLSPQESSAASSVASSPSSSTFDEIASKVQEVGASQEQGPSFAEMLRNKGARAKCVPAWPSIGSGQGRIRPGAGNSSQSSSRDVEEDDHASAPSYNQSFGDALAQAMERTKLQNTEANLKSNNGGGKRKKKNKSTLLFATSMAGNTS